MRQPRAIVPLFATECGRLEAGILLEEREVIAELARSLQPASGRVEIIFGALRSVARLLGSAANLLDHHEEALAHYDQAIEVCQKLRFRPGLALTRLDLPELLLDHYPEERDAAIEHLDFAIAELREMKMQPAWERALGRRGVLKA